MQEEQQLRNEKRYHMLRAQSPFHDQGHLDFEGCEKCKKIIEVIMSTTSASHYKKKPLEHLIAYVLYVMQVNLLQKLTTSREYRYVNKVL
jgi:hypothetical protein